VTLKPKPEERAKAASRVATLCEQALAQGLRVNFATQKGALHIRLFPASDTVSEQESDFAAAAARVLQG
jgi:hypothetical protein